jgi:adenosylmethionine-8-amino-7-oxononanoate transaminase
MNPERLAELNKRYLWQPFTPMWEWLADEPIVIESARGCRLRDTRGREYLDGTSSMWVNVLGHGRVEITRALVEQLDRVAHSTLLGLANVPSTLLAEKLVAVTPPKLQKVFFSDDGSTAMEVALKMALQYWRLVEPRAERHTFISLEHGYHGDTVGAMSLGHVPEFHAAFAPVLFRSVPMPAPTGDDPAPALEGAARVLDEHGAEAAAVVVEPLVQCAGGFLVHPKGYLAGLAALCAEHGLLLILDEVATGFGRTGTMFACEQEGVEPDIMALAKGLTNGTMPLAATLTSQAIFDAFLDGRQVFFHGHSFTGNQLGCAAALATLEIFEREHVIEHLQPKIALMRELLDEFLGLERVADVRQCGFIGVVELKGIDTGYSYGERVGRDVCRAVLDDGVLLRPLGNVVYFMPPYCITDEQLTHMMRSTRKAVESLD